MSLQKTPIAGFTFNAEVSTTAVPLTVSGTIAPDANNIATVTTSGAHGLSVGSYVTFAGAAVTGYNGTAFKVLAVPSSTTFKIASTLGTSAGTITANVLFYLPAGINFVTTGANAVVEYNPTNDGYPQGVDASQTTVTGATWRTVLAASGAQMVWSDGFGVRINCNGSAGTTRYSQVK